MATLEQRLTAGLEAQDWRETTSRGPWQRWGKFGRGAMYVFHEDQHKAESLWFSELHQSYPQYPVKGPILEQLLAAGDSALAKERPDTQAMLIELMYLGEKDGKAT